MTHVDLAQGTDEQQGAEGFLLRFRTFLEEFHEQAVVEAVGLDTDLWQSGVLDSLVVLDAVVLLGDVTGREPHLGGDLVSTFRTVRSIYDRYVATPRS